MKKIIIALVALPLLSSAQRPTMTKDTLYYGINKYYEGKQVQLLYGSGDNKNFAFVYYGTGLSGVNQLGSGFSKNTLSVDKIYKAGGKFYIRGKLSEQGVQLGNKVFIDIEGAIDNKEIK